MGRVMRLRAGLFQGLSHSIFMTPVLAHTVIIYNDYHTHISGQSISSVATDMIDLSSYALFVMVTFLWVLCTRKKIFITKLYNSFRRKGYRLNCNSVLKFKPFINAQRQRAACPLKRMKAGRGKNALSNGKLCLQVI